MQSIPNKTFYLHWVVVVTLTVVALDVVAHPVVVLVVANYSIYFLMISTVRERIPKFVSHLSACKNPPIKKTNGETCQQFSVLC